MSEPNPPFMVVGVVLVRYIGFIHEDLRKCDACKGQGALTTLRSYLRTH